MKTLRSGIVDLVRDFLLLHEQMSDLFEHSRAGSLGFEEVRALVGDGEDSLLFRIKESCHSLFRNGDSESVVDMRHEALFDLAVGSLFHEAMKFRENLYQIEVYAPKVRRLRDDAGDGARELFGEFEKILQAAGIRLEEALQETEALLALTRRQFEDLIAEYGSDGLIARTLIESPAQVRKAFPGGLDALLARVYGNAGAGYLAAALSFLRSARFDEARGALDEASAHSVAPEEVEPLLAYAEGMAAFLAGGYALSLERLANWVGTSRGSLDATFVSLAHAALSRLDRLVGEEDPDGLVRTATDLAAQLPTA